MSMFCKNKSIKLVRMSLKMNKSEFIELHPEYWKEKEMDQITKRGMSDSELISIRTLERIEKAKQGVSDNTYKKLMKNIGKNLYMSFGSLEDLKYFKTRKIMLRELDRGRFCKVRELIDDYNSKDFKQSPESKQFVHYISAMQQHYGEHVTNIKGLLEDLKAMLCITYTDNIDDDIKIENGVFKENEFIILNEIGATYIKLREYDKAFRLLSLLKKNLEYKYCSGKNLYNIYLRINININWIYLYKKDYYKVLENVDLYFKNLMERNMVTILYLYHQRVRAYEGLIGLGNDFKDELERNNNIKEAIMITMGIERIWIDEN